MTRCHNNQLGTTADRHTASRLTYYMSIDIQYVNQHTHTMYVDRDTVCQSAYSMSIGIYALMYLDRHTVCQLTYSMSIDTLYVDGHIICKSRYCMSIGSCSQLVTACMLIYHYGPQYAKRSGNVLIYNFTRVYT